MPVSYVTRLGGKFSALIEEGDNAIGKCEVEINLLEKIAVLFTKLFPLRSTVREFTIPSSKWIYSRFIMTHGSMLTLKHSCGW